MPKQLTEKAVASILEKQTTLYGPLADELGIKIKSVEQLVTRNSRRLQEYPVLKIIADHTGIPVDDLIEDYAEEKETAKAV